MNIMTILTELKEIIDLMLSSFMDWINQYFNTGE